MKAVPSDEWSREPESRRLVFRGQQIDSARQNDEKSNTQFDRVVDPRLDAGIGQTSEPYTSAYPLEGLEGLAMQEADGWLAGLDHADEGGWLKTIVVDLHGEPEPPPLTFLATDPRTRRGALYKSCKCPEHQKAYRDWPTKMPNSS
ncbi:hypothetical protein LIA77_03562 [Sarocladium implicatum]|nr:hypothetical protein LIA77_03562 [Sarocladium implicatum]